MGGDYPVPLMRERWGTRNAHRFALCRADTVLLGVWPPGELYVCGRRVEGGPG